MSTSRRTFLQLSAAAFAAAGSGPLRALAAPAQITFTGGTIHASGRTYAFSWTPRTDLAEIRDARNHIVASFPLQPLVVSKTASGHSVSTHGSYSRHDIEANILRVTYTGANGDGTLTCTLQFDGDTFWWNDTAFTSPTPQDIVSLRFFNARENRPAPALAAGFTILPGISENAAISPIQPARTRQTQSVSLGHSGYHNPAEPFQQWALPVHYFMTMSMKIGEGINRNIYTPEQRSAMMVCGMVDMPNGDPFVDISGGRSSFWIDYRSDLWHHQRTPGTLKLGCRLCFAFGTTDLDAITAYYTALVDAGIIQRKQNSPAKNALVTLPQFCTWGAQVYRGKEKSALSMPFLESLYAEMKSANLQAKIFSIDDKWEGNYGNLAHDETRMAGFPEFLDKLRAEGYQVGLWTAFMRCENPVSLGLTEEQMLHGTNGKPHKIGSYFIMDTTRPEVAKVLADRAREFMRRYKPALIKIDFGYELPLMSEGAPWDKRFAGERLFAQALDVVVPALREVNPDVVLMYYQLSPLFAKYFDLHAPDDLYTNAGDYAYEANRHFYYASPLTQLGVNLYGSTGYDWSSSPSIWFDTVALGTIGCLNDFEPDEFGESATPEAIALYNGLAHAVRTSGPFTVVPFPTTRPEAPVHGAHAKSWARLENGCLTLIAQRPPSLDDSDAFFHNTADSFSSPIHCTAPVVVSSPTGDDITSAKQLAIIGMMEGTATLKRTQGTTAHIRTHLFGGTTGETTLPIRDGKLTIPLMRQAGNGTPIEWLEVTCD